MATVYRVSVDIQKFQLLESDDSEFREALYPKMHGDEIGDEWQPPEVYVFRPKKKEGNFLGFLDGHVFAVAQDAVDEFGRLESFFQQSGEQLPLTHKGQDFVVFNCTNCINALDEEKSKYSRRPGSLITEYVFFPMRFQFTLFCIPQTKELLCLGGVSAPHDEFKGYVEENKLTGLVFEELWSYEEPREKRPKKLRKK